MHSGGVRPGGRGEKGFCSSYPPNHSGLRTLFYQHLLRLVPLGLRWLAGMLLVPRAWADRVWARPFLTGLGPSERF